VTQDTWLILMGMLYEVPLTPVHPAMTDIMVMLHPAPVVPVPVIQSISPESGLPLTTVTVTGSNFDPILSNNAVLLSWQGGAREIAPLSVNPAGMTFAVPADIPADAVSIKVRTPAGESNSVQFTELSTAVATGNVRLTIDQIIAAGGLSKAAKGQLESARSFLVKLDKRLAEGKYSQALTETTHTLDALLKAQREGAQTGTLEQQMLQIRAQIAGTDMTYDESLSIIALMKDPATPRAAWNSLMAALAATEDVVA
jgi:hypothetical protein